MAASHKLQRKMGGRQVVKEPVGLGCKALTGKGVVCMYLRWYLRLGSDWIRMSLRPATKQSFRRYRSWHLSKAHLQSTCDVFSNHVYFINSSVIYFDKKVPYPQIVGILNHPVKDPLDK